MHVKVHKNIQLYPTIKSIKSTIKSILNSDWKKLKYQKGISVHIRIYFVFITEF